MNQLVKFWYTISDLKHRYSVINALRVGFLVYKSKRGWIFKIQM